MWHTHLFVWMPANVLYILLVVVKNCCTLKVLSIIQNCVISGDTLKAREKCKQSQGTAGRIHWLKCNMASKWSIYWFSAHYKKNVVADKMRTTMHCFTPTISTMWWKKCNQMSPFVSMASWATNGMSCTTLQAKHLWALDYLKIKTWVHAQTIFSSDQQKWALDGQMARCLYPSFCTPITLTIHLPKSTQSCLGYKWPAVPPTETRPQTSPRSRVLQVLQCTGTLCWPGR